MTTFLFKIISKQIELIYNVKMCWNFYYIEFNNLLNNKIFFLFKTFNNKLNIITNNPYHNNIFIF